MLGFDTLYWNFRDDDMLARVSAAERRILLIRDRGLLKRGIATQSGCGASSSGGCRRLELGQDLGREELH